MHIHTAVKYALHEDLQDIGDITVKSLIPNTATTAARIFAKTNGVISGTQYIPVVYTQMQDLYPNQNPVQVDIITPDGTAVTYGDTIATLHGATAHIITGERTILNFIGHLSGIATTTAQAVQIAKPFGITIACTRKTTPLHRNAEKKAVVHGGGHPHRNGLYDAVMIKDNHILAISNIVQATRTAQQQNPHTKIEVEVDTLAQLQQVLPTAPDVILLDNMCPDMITDAIKIRNQIAPTVPLEASGNITPDTLKSYCQTGIDIISMGWLTHSTARLDISLELL